MINYKEEIKKLEEYKNISYDEKIKFIDKLYLLARINYNNFIKNIWK